MLLSRIFFSVPKCPTVLDPLNKTSVLRDSSPAHILLRSCLRSFKSTTQMEAANGLNHLERTANSQRQAVRVSAVVCDITDGSPTIKLLQLKVEDPRFSFKAGQWLDVFIPGVPVAGGFSLCSTQAHLEQSSLLVLAVKYTDEPPAHWVHKQCKRGDCVVVRSGGDCYYDPSEEPWQIPHHLILIAGGIGINPMLSMMKQALEKESGGRAEKILLLYSTSKRIELIFKNEIDELSQDPRVSCQYFITQEPTSPAGEDKFKVGRINDKDLERNIKSAGIDVDKAHCFICGPGHMIDTMEGYSIDLGISKDRIHYEKWW